MSVQSELNRIKGEVATQEELMGQIITALAEKSAGGIDTSSDNPATSSDIVQGKEAFVNGEPVVGSMVYATGRACTEIRVEEDELRHEASLDERIWAEDSFGIYTPLSEYGTAELSDVAKGKFFTSKDGHWLEGTIEEVTGNHYVDATSLGWRQEDYGKILRSSYEADKDILIRKGTYCGTLVPFSEFGDAEVSDVAKGKFFTSKDGRMLEGTALMPGGGSVFPDGAFAPVTSFTDGKQYALVATIDGVKRYINTTTYNDYTMNATETTISEDAGEYVIFSATPVMFTAVASGNGFLLQNGSNYLHGTTNNGTALRFGTTQAVWTIDASATGGFSDGKYHAKEDSNAVWLKCNDGSYDWCIKFESAGSFGYDREGRDNTYSTGFVPFVLYEYVAGEGEVNPIMDTSEGNLSANKMLEGAIGFSNGRRVEGNIPSRQAQTITPSTTAQEIPAGVYLEGKQTISAIQTETGSATQNGTYTPSTGKYFSSFTVNTSVGYVIKTGTQSGGTSAKSVNTGLSKIKEFFIYKETVSGTGLIHLHYSDTDGTSYTYASAWSTSSYGTKTVTSGTGNATVSGGTLTFPSTTATSGGLTSNVTYTWVAIGEE